MALRAQLGECLFWKVLILVEEILYQKNNQENENKIKDSKRQVTKGDTAYGFDECVSTDDIHIVAIEIDSKSPYSKHIWLNPTDFMFSFKFQIKIKKVTCVDDQRYKKDEIKRVAILEVRVNEIQSDILFNPEQKPTEVVHRNQINIGYIWII
jgi:hypothetical protein